MTQLRQEQHPGRAAPTAHHLGVRAPSGTRPWSLTLPSPRPPPASVAVENGQVVTHRGGVNQGCAHTGPTHQHPAAKLSLSPRLWMDGVGRGGGLPFLSSLISLGNNSPARYRI